MAYSSYDLLKDMQIKTNRWQKTTQPLAIRVRLAWRAKVLCNGVETTNITSRCAETRSVASHILCAVFKCGARRSLPRISRLESVTVTLSRRLFRSLQLATEDTANVESSGTFEKKYCMDRAQNHGAPGRGLFDSAARSWPRKICPWADLSYEIIVMA